MECAQPSRIETNEKYGKKGEIHVQSSTKSCIRLGAYTNAIYNLCLLRKAAASQPRGIYAFYFARKTKYTRKIQDTLRTDKI